MASTRLPRRLRLRQLVGGDAVHCVNRVSDSGWAEKRASDQNANSAWRKASLTVVGKQAERHADREELAAEAKVEESFQGCRARQAGQDHRAGCVIRGVAGVVRREIEGGRYDGEHDATKGRKLLGRAGFEPATPFLSEAMRRVLSTAGGDIRTAVAKMSSSRKAPRGGKRSGQEATLERLP